MNNLCQQTDKRVENCQFFIFFYFLENERVKDIKIWDGNDQTRRHSKADIREIFIEMLERKRGIVKHPITVIGAMADGWQKY